MARLKLSGVEVKAARVLVGLQGHRPSAKNACVAAKMKGQTFAKPEPGMGGRNNKAVQKSFVSNLIACGFKISAATRKKFGL